MPTGIYVRTIAHNQNISRSLIERNRIKPNPGNFKKGQVSWNKGKKASEETRRKLSESHKGLLIHPNTRKAALAVLWGNKRTLGMKMSKEFREKVSKRMMGNKLNIGRIPSKETRDKMSLSRRGEKAPNWKGGITPIHNKIRSSREYNDWEKAVILRDKKMCQKCGTNVGLVAHHILNFSTHIELRFDLDNGVTLCRKNGCHKAFHKRYGLKNNSKEQLVEFLKQ